MYKGKNTARRRMRSKSIALFVTLALILCVAAGGTLAYLVTQTSETVNTFTPSNVACEVQEKAFSNGAKSDVVVKNIGDTEAFIRATVIVTWKDAEGNVYGVAPTDNDYTIIYDYSDWTHHNDGYYYCKTAVAPSEVTPVLVERCTTTDNAAIPEDYGLSVEIIADAIQSQPVKAVQKAWGVTISGGSVTAYSGN